MIRIRECRGLKALFFLAEVVERPHGHGRDRQKNVKDLARKAHKLPVQKRQKGR